MPIRTRIQGKATIAHRKSSTGFTSVLEELNLTLITTTKRLTNAFYNGPPKLQENAERLCNDARTGSDLYF